jgi:hypothetical protein
MSTQDAALNAVRDTISAWAATHKEDKEAANIASALTGARSSSKQEITFGNSWNEWHLRDYHKLLPKEESSPTTRYGNNIPRPTKKELEEGISARKKLSDDLKNYLNNTLGEDNFTFTHEEQVIEVDDGSVELPRAVRKTLQIVVKADKYEAILENVNKLTEGPQNK